MMPVASLAATALDFYIPWVKQGALTPVETINSDDAYTSYYSVVDGAIWSRLYFSYQDLPADAISVNSLTQYATLGRTSNKGGTYNWLHKYSSVEYLVGSTLFPPSWNTHNAVITFGGGGGWTVEKVNNSSFGIRYDDAPIIDDTYYLETYHMVSVDYLASGMFAITFVIPLLGVISGSFDKLMRQLLPRVRYTREELEKIRQDVRNAQRGYSFPVFQREILKSLVQS